jgi:pimeloyl-ACP methyl ester carboxylesterase
MSSCALACLLVLSAGCGLAAGGPLARDPIAQDPPFDAAHPALSSEVIFESGGARMFGLIYEAPGAGSHPTAIVLHGFPGNERNLDLAQAIRRAGWNAVFFHYRGAWGSEGDFGFVHVLEDVAAVAGALAQPDFAARHRIDPSRLALVGHSMGGFAALVSASELPAVDCVASLAGANLGLWAEAVRTPEGEARMTGALDGFRGPIRGTSGAALVAEVRANEARFDLRRHAVALAAKPVLLVAGARDEVTPPAIHHEPLAAAIGAQPGAQVQATVLDADHAFADTRVELTRLVIGWLASDCAQAGQGPRAQ